MSAELPEQNPFPDWTDLKKEAEKIFKLDLEDGNYDPHLLVDIVLETLYGKDYWKIVCTIQHQRNGGG